MALFLLMVRSLMVGYHLSHAKRLKSWRFGKTFPAFLTVFSLRVHRSCCIINCYG